MTSRRSFDPTLPLLLTTLVALQLPWLHRDVVPVHDTFYNFVNFFVFYNHLFFEGGLVHWYPYSAYGQPAAIQQVISFTPIDYVVMAAGALLRVRDAMLLFKLAVLAEQAVFVLGMVLLSRRLFRERTTILVLGLAAAGSVVVWAQLWFELRFFYLLPLMLCFALGFLDEGRPAKLWLAGLTAVAWVLGNAPYFASLWALVLLVALAGPAVARRAVWPRLLSTATPNLLGFVGFALAAGAVAYFGLHSLDGVNLREEGRVPGTGEVPLAVFLTYGGVAEWPALARNVLFGWPPQLAWGTGLDTSAYVGLLPLVALAFALVRARSLVFLGFVAAGALVIAFSFGGVVASQVHRLPTFSGYRHIGLVYGIVKVLVLLAAGFGLERVARDRLRMPTSVAAWLALAVGMLGAALGAGALGATWDWSASWPAAVGVRLVVYLVLGAASFAATRSLAIGVLVALAFDLGLYQAAAFERAPRLSPEYQAMAAAYQVHPMPFRPFRSEAPDPDSRDPEDVRTRDATALLSHPASRELYWTAYNFTYFDPCESQYYTETWTHRVYQLLLLPKRHGIDVGERIGCHVPKLRVVSGVALFDDRMAARAAVIAAAGAPPAPDAVRDVIFIRPQHEQPPPGPPRREAGVANVTRFHANGLEVSVRVDEPQGGWLIYADAADPGWQATVDGRPAPIAEANLAFKAVWLPAGEHAVRFFHSRGAHRVAAYAVAAFGLAYGLGLVAVAARECFPRQRA